MNVLTSSEMRSVEQSAVERGASLQYLMQRAGYALASTIRRETGDGSVLLLVGPGNNGGDGLIAAQHLVKAGVPVSIYTWRRDPVEISGAQVLAAENDDQQSRLRFLASGSRVIVDALLGIGQSRPPEGLLEKILRCVNSSRSDSTLMVAVDLCTGVNADTGSCGSVVFDADLTVVMGILKRGNVVYPAAGHAGRLEIVDIGLSDVSGGDSTVRVLSDEDVARLLPERHRESNKGTYGQLLIVGGSRNYLGAPALCALAAYRAGAGLVQIALPEGVQHSVAAHALEPIYAPLPERDGGMAREALPRILEVVEKVAAVTLGPGMSLTDDTLEIVRTLLLPLAEAKKKVVIDADGLNALARTPGWWNTRTDMIVTPHPGEMGRLTGLPVSEIQQDRVGTAAAHAAKWGVVVVLKGAGTIVASPAGEIVVNPTGGPNLATAGTGDVLSGIIGSLLAQGCEPFTAAAAGVYLHGRAGDRLRCRHGDAGTIASDLLAELPAARLSIVEGVRTPR